MHNSGICLMQDGEVLAAIDEERLTRKKRDGTFPTNAFDCGLRMNDIHRSEITDVAFVDRRTPWQTMQVWKYALSTLFQTGVRPWRYLVFWSKLMLSYRRLPPEGVKPKCIHFYEHHLCHAASAYYPGPWSEATIVSLDGMGDFSIGGLVAHGKLGRIKVLSRSNGFFSPGHFYMILTEYLGFTPGHHEGKVTGLAAYGDPIKAYHTMEKVIKYKNGKLDFVAPLVAEEFSKVILSRSGERTRKWYYQEQKNETATKDEYTSRREENYLKKFRELWSGFSKKDIAAAGQARFEDIICEYIRDAIKLTSCRNLVVAGGCFANVRLNQRIRELQEVNDIYIHPNMSDGGLATGAALLHHYKNYRSAEYVHKPWPHVYLGPSYSCEEIESELQKNELDYRRFEDITNKVAEYLTDGKVIAWFQGGMEYGPRALGNRSLLVEAKDPKMPDRLNHRLGRTEFMPFAPIILDKHASDWFVDWSPEHSASRYMTITYEVEPDKRELIPAVVHVDGTARPQVIIRYMNSILYDIISRYHELTGIPLLINTSFNMHEEPIVCTPADAINSFKRGSGDVLVIGSFIVTG